MGSHPISLDIRFALLVFHSSFRLTQVLQTQPIVDGYPSIKYIHNYYTDEGY